MRPAGELWGALFTAQCAGIAFLVYQSLQPVAMPAAPRAAAPAATAPAYTDSAPALSDEVRLRQIIREELAALGSGAGAGVATAAPLPRDPERDRAQRDQIAEQIARYRSLGRISEDEMHRLQQDIAQLDPVSRREMLSQLVRAMNAREVQGQM